MLIMLLSENVSGLTLKKLFTVKEGQKKKRETSQILILSFVFVVVCMALKSIDWIV